MHSLWEGDQLYIIFHFYLLVAIAWTLCDLVDLTILKTWCTSFRVRTIKAKMAHNKSKDYTSGMRAFLEQQSFPKVFVLECLLSNTCVQKISGKDGKQTVS